MRSQELEALPRQTYLTPDHSAAEQAIAKAFAHWAKAYQLKIGADASDRHKSHVDRLLYREHVVAFFEVKQSRFVFGELSGGWTTGRRKVLELRSLRDIVHVPVLLVVRFGCGTIAYIDVALPHSTVEGFGRSDRGDPADYEPGARFRWEQFKIIERGAA